jgi:metal-dependent hydrolase (beta-lactamase superfamily II)
MKITLLGTGSGMPVAGKNHSCILLESSRANLLIDCGEPAARSLAEKKIPADFIDGIIISHLHPDHVSGIYMVLQLFHITKRHRDLYLYLPENEAAFRSTLELFYLFPARLPFELIIKNINDLNQNISFLYAVENDHLKQYNSFVNEHALSNQLKSYSFLIIGDSRALLYTSDISTTRELADQIEAAEVIIIDALHPAAGSIVEVMESGKEVILTHGMSAELMDKLLTGNWQNVTKADDHQEIQL